MTTRTIAGYTGDLTENENGTVTFTYGGGRITGDPDGIETMLSNQRDQKERRARWPGDLTAAMSKLGHMFPTLQNAPGIEPWNVDDLIAWLNSPAPGHGAACAGRFLLGVWNSTTDWTELGLTPPGRFDVFEAIAVWDNEHRAAFQAWVDAPFWP